MWRPCSISVSFILSEKKNNSNIRSFENENERMVHITRSDWLTDWQTELYHFLYLKYVYVFFPILDSIVFIQFDRNYNSSVSSFVHFSSFISVNRVKSASTANLSYTEPSSSGMRVWKSIGCWSYSEKSRSVLIYLKK